MHGWGWWENGEDVLGELKISEIKVAKPWHLWLCFDIILKVCAMEANGLTVFKQVMQALESRKITF